MIDVFDKYWAYFLGFFWGDGSVRNGAVIGIVNDDGLKIENIFEKCVPFKKSLYQPKNKRLQSYYYFRDKCFFSFLIENDYWDKSNLSPTKILSRIPKENHRYFWLGYVDADGCFYKRKGRIGGAFSLSGSYEQDWSDFLILLKELEIENFFYFQKAFSSGRSSVFEIKYGPDLFRLSKYLYPNDFEFGLKRKFDKCQSIISSLPTVSSQWKGVGYHKGEGRWRAYGPKNKYLGWFDTEEEARQARVKYLAQIAVV